MSTVVGAYTVTLSQNNSKFATYSRSSIVCTKYDMGGWYEYSWSPTSFTPPRWKDGRKRFNGYYIGSTMVVDDSGHVATHLEINADKSAKEQWTTLAPALMVKSNGSYISDLVYDGGVWYSDYANRVAFDAEHPMPIPTRECYRFLGLYSADNTTSTKYVNADGTPTADFPASISDDATIYAQWELASVKITISASSGDFAFKTFYQSKTADGNGKYGYYTDSTCPDAARIYGIPVPTRELYAWGGLRASSGSSSTLYANADGSFTAAFLDRSATATTIYGNFWTQVSNKITLDTNGGAAEPLAYYTNKTSGGIYTDWLCATTALTSLPIPAKSSSRFLGYFSGDSGGTKYVEYDGVIQSALNTKKTTTTIHAQWRAASYTIDLSGVSEIIGTIYYDATAAKFFNADSATITSVPVPVDPGNVFNGYYTEPEGGDQVIDATGAISQSYAPSGNDVIFAQFTNGKCFIVCDMGDGSGGTAEFFYDVAAAKFYADTAMTEEITSVTLPTRRLFNTLGLYDSAEGGTQVVAADGSISQSFAPTEASVVIYAHYSRNCYELDLDPGDGYADFHAIFRAPGGSTFYADPEMTDVVSNVGVPVRDGYTFGGYTYDDATVISDAGEILAAAEIDDDVTATAVWTANQYTLTFNANGGTASFASKTVTFGVAIGQLPTATLVGRRLEGWMVDGAPITEADAWRHASDKTAVAAWKNNFAGVVDYFGLSGNLLMLVGSESGEGRRVVNLWNGANEAGPGLLNPVCTYRVKAAGNVTIELGRAWRAGYMIADFEYRTGADKEPLLVVRGTANEGENAINRYQVTFRVAPDHVAQDPFGVVGGGGELIELTSGAKCDPVVPYENNKPCASDVVHGRRTVSGRTAAYFGEGKPSLASGWLDSGVPTSGSDIDFTTYSFSAERSI